jgi:hypothetical protein
VHGLTVPETWHKKKVKRLGWREDARVSLKIEMLYLRKRQL